MTTKRQSFKRVAEKRVSSALAKIESIESMLDKPYYSYTEKDVERIVQALQDKVNQLKLRRGQRLPFFFPKN